MTIKQFLFRLEYLKERKERKYEKYMKLSARASSPRSSLDIDELPRNGSGQNTREKMLLESSEALSEYYKAWNEYEEFYTLFEECIKQLDFTERCIITTIYIDNMGRPREQRYNGIFQWTDLRRAQIPPREKEAEEHLIEILKAKGIEIDKAKGASNEKGNH